MRRAAVLLAVALLVLLLAPPLPSASAAATSPSPAITDFRVTPEVPRGGENVTLTATIWNPGPATLVAPFVLFVLVEAHTPIPFAAVTNVTLAPAANTTVETHWTAIQGAHTLAVYATIALDGGTVTLPPATLRIRVIENTINDPLAVAGYVGLSLLVLPAIVAAPSLSVAFRRWRTRSAWAGRLRVGRRAPRDAERAPPKEAAPPLEAATVERPSRGT